MTPDPAVDAVDAYLRAVAAGLPGAPPARGDILPGTLAPLPIAAATAASLTRLALARRAARSCLAIRATLA